MNKREKKAILSRVKPATWYAYCQMEAWFDDTVVITKADLALRMGLSGPTLTKTLSVLASHKLVTSIAGGFRITQMDGADGEVSEIAIVREFKNAADILNYWCDCYEETYGQRYVVSNTVVAYSQLKRLLANSDDELKGTIEAAITLYERLWATPSYTRPTIGQLSSWLFAQAQPYAISATANTVLRGDESVTTGSELLSAIEAKGWL